jgi:two-component system sensor histidine kinase HydH
MLATPAGGTVDVDARVAPDRTWHIAVRDSGAGIPADVLGRLFEPFFTTRNEGTGLGLAIVRTVVEAHGGHVDARSTPGAGSVFTISLPAADASASAPPVSTSMPAAAGGVR